MLAVLILAVLALVAVCVVLLQRRKTRKPPHKTYFSHTLGISDPASPAARDEPPAT